MVVISYKKSVEVVAWLAIFFFIGNLVINDTGFSIDNRAITDNLFGNEIILSASQVEKFYLCKFQYFFQYGLRLRISPPGGQVF